MLCFVSIDCSCSGAAWGPPAAPLPVMLYATTTAGNTPRLGLWLFSQHLVLS